MASDGDRRPALPELELLVMLQEDPVSVEDLMLEAGVRDGAAREHVRDYVRRTVEGPLRAGRIRALHFYGTASEPVLDDGMTPDDVLRLMDRAVQAIADGADSIGLDFWFEATETGEAEYRRLIGLT